MYEMSIVYMCLCVHVYMCYVTFLLASAFGKIVRVPQRCSIDLVLEPPVYKVQYMMCRVQVVNLPRHHDVHNVHMYSVHVCTCMYVQCCLLAIA